MKYTLLFLLLASPVFAQTHTEMTLEDNQTVAGRKDFSGASSTAPIKSGTLATAPATCVALTDLYLATDRTVGQQLYQCNATGNGWVAMAPRRVCDIAVGDTSGSAITNAQLGPQKRMCFIPVAATIVEMDVAADGGTPNVIVAVNHAGTPSNIVSSALATASAGGIACSKTSGVVGIDGVTTCSATLQNTSIAAGDYLELVSGTAGGTAKLMTIHVIYTIN